MIPALALAAGALLVALVLQDAFEVMLLPRRVRRRARFVRVYFRLSWRAWRAAASAWGPGPRRERFLSVFGALSMMVLFTLWAGLLVLGFALVQWGLAPHPGGGRPATLGAMAYMSGLNFFTLGFADATPQTGLGRTVTVLEGGTGFGFMAVVIGYLPVLYQLFARREAHVMQLDARAGSPPSAVSILVRHAESEGLECLDEFLRTWELWAADLLESHLSYPMLAFYRSQHDDQSWLAALVTVMDACALVLVGVADVKPLQARMTFAICRHVVVEMARSLEVRAVDLSGEARLDHAGFEQMLNAFQAAGLAWDGGETGEETLGVVRATYEPVIAAIGPYLRVPLPPWLPSNESPDHWERGHRGVIARRMVSGLADGSFTGPAQPSVRRRFGGARRGG